MVSNIKDSKTKNCVESKIFFSLIKKNILKFMNKYYLDICTNYPILLVNLDALILN